MERREFLKNTGLACMGCIGAVTMLEGCASVYYAQNTLQGNTIFVKASEFIQAKDNTKEHKYILVKSEKLPAPIFLNKVRANEYSAVLMECTHKRCEINAANTILHCPCHGSEFALDGKVLQGPAETDLKKYKVTTEGENILIHL